MYSEDVTHGRNDIAAQATPQDFGAELETQLIQSLYTTSLSNQYPQHFLDLITQHCRVNTAMILVADWTTQNMQGLWSSGDANRIQEHVEGELYLDDPLINMVLSNPFGEFYASNITTPNWKTECSKEALEWSNNNQIFEGAASVISLSDTIVLGTFFHRTDQQGEFKQTEIDFFNRLIPHMHKSFLLHQDLSELKQESLEAPAIINSLPLPTLVIDESYNVSLSNDKAKKWMADTGLASIENKQLSLVDSQQRNFIAMEVSRLIQDINEINPVGNNVISHDESVIHWAHNEETITFVLRPIFKKTDKNTDSVAKGVMCFIYHANQSVDLDERALQNIFHLSDREAQICQLLVKGIESKDIADTLCLSVHTVRDAIKKRIFKKCNVSSQNELISMLLSSPAAFST